MSFLVKCDVLKSENTGVEGTIPYIQPATRKEYFEIAENNNKILSAIEDKHHFT